MNMPFTQMDYTYKLEQKSSRLDSFQLNVELIRELSSFIVWVEKQLTFLEDKVETLSSYDCDLDITYNLFNQFQRYYHSNFKPAFSNVKKQILNSNHMENDFKKFIKMLEVVKKPFEEIKNYPISCGKDQFEPWFNALSEALEISTSKIRNFAARIGLEWELSSPIGNERIYTSQQHIKLELSQQEDLYKNDTYIGGLKPSSSVTAA